MSISTLSSTPSTCRLVDRMYPDELQALEPNFVTIPDLIRQASPQKPSYKVNDSDDTDLVEIISPLSDLKRNLARGKSLTTSRQFCHSNYSVSARGESSPPKPHFKKPQHHDHPRNNNVFHGLHNLELLGLGSHSSKPKLVQRTTFKEGTKKMIAYRGMKACEENYEERLVMKDVHNNLRESQVVGRNINTSHESERKTEFFKDLEEKANELRHISKIWHQDCENSISIQQRLTNLLNAKYKKAYADGRMCLFEKCKHEDFKSEVGQILKRMETAGALQMPNLRTKYKLAVECVDDVCGRGMGEEYMKLEMYYLQANAGPTPKSSHLTRDSDHVKEMVRDAPQKYSDVQNVVEYMLEQLS